jgi:hypothetical protein
MSAYYDTITGQLATNPYSPTPKSPAMEALLQAVNPSHRDRRYCIEHNLCTWCGKAADSFRDRLSEKEYCISGLCQSCQDSIWNSNNE